MAASAQREQRSRVDVHMVLSRSPVGAERGGQVGCQLGVAVRGGRRDGGGGCGGSLWGARDSKFESIADKGAGSAAAGTAGKSTAVFTGRTVPLPSRTTRGKRESVCARVQRSEGDRFSRLARLIMHVCAMGEEIARIELGSSGPASIEWDGICKRWPRAMRGSRGGHRRGMARVGYSPDGGLQWVGYAAVHHFRTCQVLSIVSLGCPRIKPKICLWGAPHSYELA
jgi:hypothetical protein